MCPLLVEGFFYPRLERIWHINKVIDWLIDWLTQTSLFDSNIECKPSVRRQL